MEKVIDKISIHVLRQLRGIPYRAVLNYTGAYNTCTTQPRGSILLVFKSIPYCDYCL